MSMDDLQYLLLKEKKAREDFAGVRTAKNALMPKSDYKLSKYVLHNSLSSFFMSFVPGLHIPFIVYFALV